MLSTKIREIRIVDQTSDMWWEAYVYSKVIVKTLLINVGKGRFGQYWSTKQRMQLIFFFCILTLRLLLSYFLRITISSV